MLHPQSRFSPLGQATRKRKREEEEIVQLKAAVTRLTEVKDERLKVTQLTEEVQVEYSKFANEFSTIRLSNPNKP
jgi:hypothetical protein